MIHTQLIGSIPRLLNRQAREHPDKLAFEDARQCVNYGELNRATANLAAHLQATGVGVGDRVAIVLGNSVEWVIACLAIVRIGAIAVPVSVDATPGEIEYRLSDSAANAVIINDRRLAEVRPLGEKVLAWVVVEGDAIAEDEITFHEAIGNSSGLPWHDIDDVDAAAFLVYTSGTTGKAKGVILSTRSMLWVTAACWVPIAGLSEHDHILGCLPLYHSYALNFMVVSVLAVGASIHLMEHYSSSKVAALLAEERFTVLPGVPTMFHYLLDSVKNGQVQAPKSLRLCLSAGAILSASVNKEFEEHFGVKLLDGYGITETSTMVTLNWPHGTRVMGSCGLPIPGICIRIVDPQNDEDVAPGQEGELLVRGPNLMKGYLNRPEETASVLRGGWYHTGDLARVDGSGFLTITGRLKELIIRGGQNIAPAEVEDVVNGCDGVLECAVVGIPHMALGEVPVAFVVLKAGVALDVERVLAHCRDHLSSYKVPYAIESVMDIPRTGSGKVLRFQLREKFQEVGNR